LSDGNNNRTEEEFTAAVINCPEIGDAVVKRPVLMWFQWAFSGIENRLNGFPVNCPESGHRAKATVLMRAKLIQTASVRNYLVAGIFSRVAITLLVQFVAGFLLMLQALAGD
jgi:hypothetical protein